MTLSPDLEVEASLSWKRPLGAFAVFVLIVFALFLGPVRELIAFVLSDHHFSHIALIPLVSIYLLFTERQRVFCRELKGTHWAWVFVIPGFVVYFTSRSWGASLPGIDALALSIFSLLLLFWATFVFAFGTGVMRAALFPIGFLLFVVPIPSFLLQPLIERLLWGSAEVTEVLFKLTGTPVFRDDAYFVLPGVSIEIAEQCSGIRSTLALFVTGIVATHMFLRAWWSRSVLIVSLFPLSIFKNGLRIVTLTLLSIHVDPGFLDGDLHHKGGIVFFLITLGVMGLILLVLQFLEGRRGRSGDRT